MRLLFNVIGHTMNMNPVFFEYSMVVTLILYTLSAAFVFLHASRPATLFVLAGLILNLIFLVSRGQIGNNWYLFPMVDELYLIPAIMAAFMYPAIGKRERNEVVTIMGTLLIATFIAVIADIEPPSPTIKGKSLVASLFFLSEAISVTLFLTAGAVAAAMLPAKLPVKESWNGLLLWGFVMFTLCQILGALWAFLGWSYPFSWSNRHLLSASIWCFYGAAIHLRYIGMNLKSKALLTILGIVPVVFMVYHHQVTELLGVIL